MFKKISLAASVTLLSGCVIAQSPPSKTVFGNQDVINTPAINVQSTAEIGQNIISKVNLRTIPAIMLSNNVSEAVNPPGTTTVYGGVIPLYTSNALGKFYQNSDYSSSATYTMLGSTIPSGERAGIFVPDDKAKAAVIYHFANGYNYGNVPVSIKDTVIEQWASNSFKKELVYSGVSQNTITILYREFIDNMARPAFSQELKYDLSQGKEIGYKGARLEVMKATNTELVYKVIKSLD